MLFHPSSKWLKEQWTLILWVRHTKWMWKNDLPSEQSLFQQGGNWFIQWEFEITYRCLGKQKVNEIDRFIKLLSVSDLKQILISHQLLFEENVPIWCYTLYVEVVPNFMPERSRSNFTILSFSFIILRYRSIRPLNCYLSRNTWSLRNDWWIMKCVSSHL